MEYRPLGRTGLTVSSLCLGTMTWGTQNTRDEAFEQMDYARERGINFFDTAEMYPTPYADELHGRTEEIIGEWLKARGTRNDLVLATKALGPSPRFKHVRGEGPRFTRANLESAVDASLRRLGTDSVELYQLHWPARPANYFGKLGFDFVDEGDWTPLADTLDALDAIQRTGKIQHIGVSNETPWGVMRFLALAEQRGGPRIASIQNPYSLLNRSFECGNAEVAIREDCGLLAYAPLAAGMLTGKYLHGAQPPDARLTLYPQNSRYRKEQGLKATEAYVEVARRHGVDPAQMAIKYVESRPFTTSAIIGATKRSQLRTDIDAAEITLPQDLLAELEDIHSVYTYPCP